MVQQWSKLIRQITTVKLNYLNLPTSNRYGVLTSEALPKYVTEHQYDPASSCLITLLYCGEVTPAKISPSLNQVKVRSLVTLLFVMEVLQVKVT
jgi:hypothetical protein